MTRALHLWTVTDRAVRAAWETLALGLFSSADLDGLTQEYYSGARRYFGTDYNAGGLSEWESRALHRFFPDATSLQTRPRVLVTSAGAGREALALAGLGWSVTAVECVGELAAAARDYVQEKGYGSIVEVVRLPPGELPPATSPYDAVVVGWGGYSHMQGTTFRIDFLRRVARSLVRGGPLLVSYLGNAGGIRRRDRVRAAVASSVRRLRAQERVEPGDRLGFRGFTHLFVPGEVRREADEAGYDVVWEAQVPYPHAVLVARHPGGTRSGDAGGSGDRS